MVTPPYVRVLGFSKQGLSHLKKPQGVIPIITRASQIKELDEKIAAKVEDALDGEKTE